ncbi:hypothetical protein LOK49_LG12G00448 [Camellia lanceoleosa]|uniref:Uncharacterized protein n=1 Tax=Camellia lanceoleosa TaxID=1840588 RepID=A0ACC0FUW7_9ERIC|nr:hypothetical protein LOK49_LG12G00448 [Camellia lanceoleosa]
MEPLTTQQEVLLDSDDQNDRVVQDEESKDTMKEDSCLSKTGIDNDSSLSIENNEASDESRQSGSDVGYTFNSGDGITNASIQEDLQNESAIDDMSVAPDRNPGTPPPPEDDCRLQIGS